MSGQDWPVGTVATATVRGVEGARVMRTGVGWFICDDDTGMWQRDGYGVVTDVRPLIVLDLAVGDVTAERAAEFVVEILRQPRHAWTEHVADQIEAQTKPPRIPEPGLWGVIEATLAGSDYPRRWIRDGLHDDAQWVALEATMRREWDHLVDPVELRPGIEDEA